MRRATAGATSGIPTTSSKTVTKKGLFPSSKRSQKRDWGSPQNVTRASHKKGTRKYPRKLSREETAPPCLRLLKARLRRRRKIKGAFKGSHLESPQEYRRPREKHTCWTWSGSWAADLAHDDRSNNHGHTRWCSGGSHGSDLFCS